MPAELTDPRFCEAIRLFHAGEFFPCHDVLEELWGEAMGEERNFLQGMLHAAVALHHFSEGNLGGARKMHDSCLRYLAGSGSQRAGLDLQRFRHDFSSCFEPLLGAHNSYPVDVQLDLSRLPQWQPIPSDS